MFEAIQEILYFVPDRGAAAEWFSQLLELPISTLGNPDHVCIRVGEQEIWFHQADEKTPSQTGGQVAYWRVADFDAVVLRAQRLGAVLHRGPLDRQDGTFMAQLKPPFGAVIGLVGPPSRSATLSLGAALQHRSWLCRVLQISGDLELDVEFNARRVGIGLTAPPDPAMASIGHVDSGINLFVNGDQVPFRELTVGECRHLAFLIRTGSTNLHAYWEVKLEQSWSGVGLLSIAELRFAIFEEVLYEEIGGKVTLQRSPLPIPATPPRGEAFPIPARTTLETDNLPLPSDEGNR